MTPTQLQNIIEQGESETVEFKTTFNNEALITINAFANTKGGLLLIGVSNEGIIKGVDIKTETIQNWLNEVKGKMEPSLLPNVSTFTIAGCNLLLFEIQEFPVKPITLKGRCYSRKTNSNHLLSIDEIIEYRLNSLNLSFDAFPVETSFDQLDNNAIELLSEKIKDKGRFRSSKDLLSDLTKLGFINKNKLTRAMELLLGSHHTSIHIGRFKSPSTIIDDIVIRSPLVVAVEEAMTFIKRNISLAYNFTGELQRDEKWQYPLQAIREILLNAIIHRDYRKPTDLIIKIFDDRIEFSNPGNLYGSLTVEDLATDTYQPQHRNKLIAEAFYLMGEVEKYGTGFIRIRDWLKSYPKLSYQVISKEDFTKVSLVEDDKLGDKLGDNQKRIIDIIAKQPQVSQSEISKQLNISQTAVENNIKKLKQFGILKRIGPAKSGHWEILK
ncbi:MAG: putative DNA binding domain-containing protein [Prolixibacteraceae bacterium]|jgi:ATP-dependent DNA helicase RecG|nr:putative DNA binding domain-containing protein [Prolixibacteraceae bacterium]